MTGLGAALSDILYALLTGYGLSFMYDFLNSGSVAFWIKLLGTTIMFVFGVHTYRSNPMQNTRNVSRNKSNLLLNCVTGFFITLANPMIILLFMALFTPFSFMSHDLTLPNKLIGYSSIFFGAMAWWFFITYVVNKLRCRFDVRGICIINKVIGAAVMIGSFTGAILMATGIV